MIAAAVTLVADRLNQHLRTRFSVGDDLAAPSPPVDAEGKQPAGARNRLILFITGVTRESLARALPPRAPPGGGRSAVATEPVQLNVHLMMAAAFDADNYLESLKVLSAGARFFQANPVFSPNRAQGAGLAQLAIEISDLDVEAANQIWSMHGGRYLPSIHYKLRLVTIDAAAVTREEPLVLRPRSDIEPSREHAP